MMKKLLFYALVGAFTLVSCSNENDPLPEPTGGSTFKLKSSGIIEFKQVHPGQAKNLSVQDVPTYFGQRVEHSSPSELNFKNDSLFITKAAGITEKYKTKWEGNELYLYRDRTNAWEYIGQKSSNGQFLLNTGFYILRSQNAQRTLNVTGQGYSYTTYSGMLATFETALDASTSVIWAKAQYVFE